VKNAMPADEPIFDFYIETLKRLAPDAQWCAAGIGAAQYTINDWAIRKGGHTRTGLEDNVRIDRDTLAGSNAALVTRAVELCDRYKRPVATWRQARTILGLRPVTVEGEFDEEDPRHGVLGAGGAVVRRDGDCGGRVRAVRHSGVADCGDQGGGDAGPDGGVEQRRG